MKPVETLQRFDEYLFARQLQLEAVVIGGAALALLGVTSRETKDCDILHPELPEAIRIAARDFAGESRARGLNLAQGWLNNGPSSLTKMLPAGWELRLQRVFTGQALVLDALERMDLLRTKLFALCDRDLDLPDCIALRPSESELATALLWLREQDLNPLWPQHVQNKLADLARRLGHGL